MTDRPILFSGPMVRAIWEGSKTQTRRILKLRKYDGFFQFGPSDTPGYDWTFRRKDHVWEDFRHEELLKLLPVQIGDRLWVKETYCLRKQMDSIKPSDCSKYEPVGYLADGSIRQMSCAMIAQGKTRVSIHMPRWASRITLQITDVRVERLQDISREDCVAEGCKGWLSIDSEDGLSPEEEFEDLWKSINGPDSWRANPWVAAYTFETVLQNIDMIEAAA